MKFMKKSILASVAVTLSCTSLPVHAIETNVIDEKWGKPTVVYGAGLNANQIQATAELFNITNSEYVNELIVDAYDVNTYLGYSLSSGSSLISSVMVQKTDMSGVVVNILTPENITKITEEQYANAAITAGVTNCEIDVASIMSVTGESALTGVYKAFEANGEVLDPERTEVAQDELQITNEIAQENEGQENFDSNVLDQTMLEIKQELANQKQKNGALSQEDIQNIVNEIIQKYKLNEILTEENINAIIEFAKKYANTSAIDSQDVLNSFSKNFGDLLKQAQDSGLLDRIIQWFKDLFNL